MMETMEAHGIPTTYAESPVVAAAGQVWRALPDARIRELLGRGVILDAVAAGVLFERGFAAEIGLEAWQQPVFLDELGPLAAEEFHAEQFGGRDKMFLTLTVPNLSGRPSVSLLQPASAAIVLSHLVDPDACRRQIASYAFANSLGGRVIVLSYELETAVGVSWFHPFRQTMLQNAVRWLSRNRPPVLVSGDGVYPLAFRKDCGSRTVLGLFNLSLDPWKTIEFEFAGPHGDAAPVSARILQPDGSSRTHTDLCVTNTGNGCLRLRFNEDTVGALSFAKPFVAELAWE